MKHASSDTDEWQNYRRAFRQFRDRVRALQIITGDPENDRARVDAAMVEAEKARVEYNNARDALVAQLLPGEQDSTATLRFRASSDVKAIAGILWELSGRPQDTATDDWYRAEEILRRAAVSAGR